MHKKKYLYFSTGFLVLLLTVCVNSLGNTLAVDFNDYYNFDSGDLRRFYNFAKQQSIDMYPEYYSEYSSVMSVWDEADSIWSGDRNWDTIAQSLNQTLYNNFNSKTGTTDYHDYDFIMLFVPSMGLTSVGASQNQTAWFMFIPYTYHTLNISESRGTQTVSGETKTYYSFTLRLCEQNGATINTNINNVTNNFLLMSVPLNDAVPIGFASKEGTNNSFFTQWGKYYRGKYNWSYSYSKIYAYGVARAIRNLLASPRATVWFHGYDYGSNMYGASTIYYYLDLDTDYMYTDPDFDNNGSSSGDSGDTSGEGIDLTETNTLLGNLSTDLTSTPGSGDFNMISSGDIVSSLGGFQISLPLADFWNYLITNLRDCLDYTGTASLHIQTAHFERTLYPSDFAFTFPEPLQTFIPALWTFIALLVLLKYSYSIYKGIASGDALSVAGKISNEDIDEIL